MCSTAMCCHLIGIFYTVDHSCSLMSPNIATNRLIVYWMDGLTDCLIIVVRDAICKACNKQSCCRKCSQAHPLCIVHEVQALHKLLLGEIALITGDSCPHIFQSSLWQAPLHEGSKAISSLHTRCNADIPLQCASHISYAVAAANIQGMAAQ